MQQVKQRIQNAGLFAGGDQVAEQGIEIQREFAEGLR